MSNVYPKVVSLFNLSEREGEKKPIKLGELSSQCFSEGIRFAELQVIAVRS